MNLPEKWHLPFVIILCLFIFLPHLGLLPVNIMEARNFITAREMVQDHHWILTTMNGEARYEKPPLPTWITAISAVAIGWNEVAGLRVPAVLMAIVLISSSYFFARKLTDNSIYAIMSAGIMTTSFYILWAGRNGQWDIFTHAFMMACIYQLYQFFTQKDHVYRHALLAGLFFGFSFMSKGPVSMYALLLPFLISYGVVFGFRNRTTDSSLSRALPLLLFLIVSIILSGWWHLYIFLYDTHAAREITEKEVGNWNSYNVRPFYYYWNFFIQSGTWAIAALVSLIYPYLKNRVFDRKAYRFTLIWTLGAVVLLSVIPEKKPRYLMPVLIPLAMNTGFYIEYLFRHFMTTMSWPEKVPVWVQFGLIGLVGMVVPFAGYGYLGEQLDGYWFWFISLSISLFVSGVLIFQALWRGAMRRVFFLSIGFMCALVLFGLPLSNAITDNPQYKDLSGLPEWESKTGISVYEFREATPELIWTYGQPMPVLYRKGNYNIPDENRFAVLVSQNQQETFKKIFKDYEITRAGHYDLNNRGRDQGGHKDRLFRDFYLITKPSGSDHNL